MDREVVEQKLESLRRCLRRIETKCPVESSTLITDIDLQDIISLNLSRAVQISVDIGAHLIAGMEVPPPDTMGQTWRVHILPIYHCCHSSHKNHLLNSRVYAE